MHVVIGRYLKDDYVKHELDFSLFEVESSYQDPLGGKRVTQYVSEKEECQDSRWYYISRAKLFFILENIFLTENI